MSVPVVLDVDFVDFCRSEYLAGESLERIGDQLGVSAGQVADALPRHLDGDELRTSFLSCAEREVAALVKSGMTKHQIAAQRGVTRNCVSTQVISIRAAGYRIEAITGAPVRPRPAPTAPRIPILRETTRQGRALLLQGWPIPKMRAHLKLSAGAASGIAFRLRQERAAAERAARERVVADGAPSRPVSLFAPLKGDGHASQAGV